MTEMGVPAQHMYYIKHVLSSLQKHLCVTFVVVLVLLVLFLVKENQLSLLENIAGRYKKKKQPGGEEEGIGQMLCRCEQDWSRESAGVKKKQSHADLQYKLFCV